MFFRNDNSYSSAQRGSRLSLLPAGATCTQQQAASEWNYPQAATAAEARPAEHISDWMPGHSWQLVWQNDAFANSDNQLDFEPLVNAYFSVKRKWWQMPGFSSSITGDLAVGNFFTFGQAGLDVRLGNAPDGFLSQPAPIGRGLDVDASLRRPGARYTYLSLAARITGFAHALPRDGNLFRSGNEWTENNTINPKRWVHQLLIGVHHERPGWGVHLHFW